MSGPGPRDSALVSLIAAMRKLEDCTVTAVDDGKIVIDRSQREPNPPVSRWARWARKRWRR